MRTRTLILLTALACLTTTGLMADQINFNFTVGGTGSVSASASGGLTAGPSTLTSISNTTTSVNIPTSGTFVTATTGPATSFIIGAIATATFGGKSGTTLLVEDAAHNVLVSGSMLDGSSLLSTIPAGAGSFLGTFDVTKVDPATLALFGLGPKFDPVGSVAFTFANANASGGVFTADIGGGSVTIQTPPVAVVPEPSTLALCGAGILFVISQLKLKQERTT